MAKLSDAIKTLHAADLGGNVPPEMISAVNVFMREVTNAVGGGPSGSGGNLSLTDNLLCELRTGNFDHGVATAISLNKLKRAAGVTIISSGSPRATPTSSYPVLYCNLQGSTRTGQVLVTMNFLDVSAKQVPVTFALWPEGSISSSPPSRQEPWRYVGATGQPAFQNGWANFGNANNNVRFAKDAIGYVHLGGTASGGTTAANTLVYTLPAGYRPLNIVNFPAISNGLFGGIYVDTNGNVRIITASNIWLTFEGITFLAEQ